MTIAHPGPPRFSGRALKLAAYVAALPAVGVLLLFAFGEMGAGDLSGLQHLVQLAPLALLLAAAWRFPLAAGAALVAVSLLLAVAYPFAVSVDEPATIALVALLFFAPPLVSGVLFILAGRRASSGS
jgi:hypothetical protein